MLKPKAIFIGDYGNQKTVEMLKAFYNKYCDALDILVSGYSISRIKNEEEIAENCFMTGMKSSKFMYYRGVAQYVIITTSAARYIKTKKNQEVIYVLSDVSEASFMGVVGNISSVITDKQTTYDFFSNKTSQIKISLVEDINSNYIECLEKEIQIENDIEQDYLLVSVKNDPQLREANGARYFVKSIAEKTKGTVIAITKNNLYDVTTNNLYFDSSDRTNKFLREFIGTIIFYDEESRLYFHDYLKNEEIPVKDNYETMLEEYNLRQLEWYVKQHENLELNESESEYVKYRYLIERIYEIDECDKTKVSIIICRYNTPYDLLTRAIRSGLNCGHENVEVIVVDDGSEVNIGEKIKNDLQDERVVYYYKENEGPGLSREYGIEHSNGKYVFYLDSDDTIHPQSMRCLVAHAEHFNIKMAIGKRILCDENGTPRNESLKYLANKSFACYYGGDYSTNSIFTNVMVNNLLINKKFLEEENVHFNKGLYEDVEYTSHIYQKCPEYHFINIDIHDWYQYGDSSTISSTPSISNLKERISKENSAWGFIPERLRKERLRLIMSIDFNLYLNAYFHMKKADRQETRRLLGTFVSDKKEYLQPEYCAERVQELIRAILQDNEEYFDYVINRYYMPETNDGEYDNYVVFTHYHLFVAILRTIASKRKTRLFIGQFYTAFNTRMIHKLKECGLFDSVESFVFGSIVSDLFEELKLRPGEADIIIPEHLYNPFSVLFRECNPKKDTMYIFSDTHPYWYYIEREFENIVKLEDAYNSFDREVKTHKMTGIWAGIQEYEGKEYPLMFYKSEKISRIITSSVPEDISDFYLKKIVVEDTKELEKKYKKELREVLLGIYDVDTSLFTENSVLLLTQPLALFGYCTKNQQKKLMKKMCEGVSSENLLIKPHPADKENYKYLGGTVLPKNVPIEVYNQMDIQIDKAITFGSSAIETITFAKEKINFFKLHDIEFDEVVDAIKEMIKEPKSNRVTKAIKRRVKRLLK